MVRNFSIFFLIASGLLAARAEAGPLAISPTTVEIADGRRSAVIEVRNQDGAAVDLQFRAYAWSQDDGKDRLTPTDNIVVSPAIATVPPGGTQLFRILQTTAASADREQTYRLRLNQIPQNVGRGIGINLEFLLPLFAGGNELSPRLRRVGFDGSTRIANDGGRHIKITALELRRAGVTVDTVPQNQPIYILPGSVTPLSLKAPKAGADTQIIAQSDRGPVDVAATSVVARR